MKKKISEAEAVIARKQHDWTSDVSCKVYKSRDMNMKILRKKRIVWNSKINFIWHFL